MEIILGNGGHLALQVKKNNPALYEEIVSAFDIFEQQINMPEEKRKKRLLPYLETYDATSSREKNRERMEYRKMQVCQSPDFLSKSSTSTYKDLLPLLGTIGCSKSPTLMMDYFCDNPESLARYLFCEMESLY